MNDGNLLLWLCIAMALPVGVAAGMLAYWFYEVRPQKPRRR